MTVLLSAQIGKYISKEINTRSKVLKFKKPVHKNFDDSLRNYHPNKGE